MIRRAAIDIGTNTVRLLVADVRDVDVAPERVFVGLEITRLGQGVDAERRLHPEAVERTLRAVTAFVRKARELEAAGVRIAGTSVLRDAADRDAFADAVRLETGERLEVLDGATEGSLAYLGATLARGSGRFVVCDIGGGSTELVTASSSVSLDVGSVRLRERCLPSDPPGPDEVKAARAVVSEALEGADLKPPIALVAVAGTVTTLAAAVLGLDAYDPDRVDGLVLERRDVAAWCERLLAMKVDDIVASWAVIPRGRADVLGAGVLILDEVMSRWDLDEVTVSERDILDGLVVDAERRARGLVG